MRVAVAVSTSCPSPWVSNCATSAVISSASAAAYVHAVDKGSDGVKVQPVEHTTARNRVNVVIGSVSMYVPTVIITTTIKSHKRERVRCVTMTTMAVATAHE